MIRLLMSSFAFVMACAFGVSAFKAHGGDAAIRECLFAVIELWAALWFGIKGAKEAWHNA